MGSDSSTSSRPGDAIRHFCQGIGDPNPLYQDESYARQTKFGTIIAPPCFLYSVYWCSGRTGGLPGVHAFHSGSDWEWFRPIYMDDRISVKEQFSDLEEMPSRFAGKTIKQSSTCHYYNQRGEVHCPHPRLELPGRTPPLPGKTGSMTSSPMPTPGTKSRR